MAFGADEEVWEDLINDVRRALATVAKAIAQFEPVMMLVRPEERKLANTLCGENVTLIDAPLNDIWIRDTGPTFVINSKRELGAVYLNFNGWGDKQEYEEDAAVAEFVANRANAKYLVADIVGEGGGIAPEFGDSKADSKCKELLTMLFPERRLVQLNIDAIAAGGGGIHCATQQEPIATK
jgi:agmatine deiminase